MACVSGDAGLTRTPMRIETLPQAPSGAESQDSALQLAASKVLSPFAATGEAERLSVLEADVDLVQRLMFQGYQGRDWNRFATALAEYGIQVVYAWVKSGLIFRKCREKGFGGLLVLGRKPDDTLELALETVGYAIAAFRENVLIPGRWDPARGATLKTFFIGQCLLQFPNVYRRWQGETGWSLALVDPDVLARELTEERSLPIDVDRKAELSRTWKQLRPGDRRTVSALEALDFDHAEIAEVFGVTKRALDSKLYRGRKARAR
jgi:hypothetical protein